MNDNDPDMSDYEKEVIEFVEKLIKVQEKLIPDFRKSFEANTLLEKQREIFVSSFMRLTVTVFCNATFFLLVGGVGIGVGVGYSTLTPLLRKS